MIAAILAGSLTGVVAAWAPGRRTRPPMAWPHLPPAALAVGVGAAAGMACARALGDPLCLPLGAALGWGAADLIARVGAERSLLARTQAVVPALQRVEQELQAGAHPLTALAWAVRDGRGAPALASAVERLGADLGEGETLARAAAGWAVRESLPVLRLFARLLALHAAWGSDLGTGLRRVLREAERSVAFGAQGRTEHRLYEVLTAAFLAVDLAAGAAALGGWPRAIASPVATPWGHALLIGSAILTALAVALPVSLAAGSPPRARRVARRG